ncbi:TetR/AcrR family transcriptional regulator [Blastococcus goldschmidtiae]|uniref:TetR/AcrR family transcriptional regulator n=1 Tax=Blastococcus goldschmidtiae TaxID=3075546 RepID=A0ABU2K4G5_9ACTN|nr:TetR/AcrR family transcriptional regulator [Blastococcus sp. DSM 46792]MDT0275069.1 TetR/AcrR family transcriptional regulator [Blastococcus sp. DSM 46792]
MARPSNRERVLDAFEHLLVDDVGVAVTLDAVAAAAEVSKGGLLYHFPSKDTLIDGLADRLREQVAEDVAALRSAPEGPVAYWLSSSSSGSPAALTRTSRAVLRLAGAGQPTARAVLEEADRAWAGALGERIPDPVIARLVLLVGDGLFLETLTGLPARSGLAPLQALLERLVRGD